MSAATAMRVKTERLTGNPQSAPQLANTEIFANTIVMLDSSGRARPGATATGCVGAGVAKTRGGLPSWDNNPGSDGDMQTEYEEGVFGPFDNSGSSIAVGDEGKDCYVVDDQTVHRTDGSGTRSPAGRIHKVTSAGVYIDISAKISREIAESQIVSTGVVLTQTFATADATHAARTAVAVTDSTGGSTADTILAAVTAPTALTDNTGGVAATTLASITNAANAGSADVAPVANALAQLAASQAQNRAAIVALTNAVAKLAVLANANRTDGVDTASFANTIADILQTAGIAS